MATANQPARDQSYSAFEPDDASNFFAPIDLTARGTSARRTSRRVSAPLPGQRYPLPRGDEAPACAAPPLQAADPSAYQQAYWQHLRQVAPAAMPTSHPLPDPLRPVPVRPGCFPAPHWSSQPEEPASMAEYPDTSETPFFMEGSENAAGEGLYYDAAYYEAATEFPHEQPEPFYEPTSLTAAPGPITPESYEAGLRPSTPPEPRKRDSAGKAFQTPRKNPPTHKQVVVRRGTLIACGLLTLFLGMKSGLLLFSTLQNDREVEQAKQDYYQHNGVPLDQSATRVDLLPPGQTYVPTATPVPVITPTPSPRIAVEDAGMAAMAERERQQAALPTDTPCGRVKLKQYPDNPMLVISDRFKTLRQQNKDIVGQITISGLLDELVVQRSDNGYYLTHNAKGEYDTLGAVYADAAISLKRPTENLLLRAKCADSSQGFGPLLRYRDGGEAMVQNYPAIHLSTLFEEADYLIFSCFTAQTNPSASDYFNFSGFPTFSSDKQAASYIQAAQNQSIFPFNVDVLPSDRLLTLATIGGNNDGSCFVILARMMREEEQMTAP